MASLSPLAVTTPQYVYLIFGQIKSWQCIHMITLFVGLLQ